MALMLGYWRIAKKTSFINLPPKATNTNTHQKDTIKEKLYTFNSTPQLILVFKKSRLEYKYSLAN